MNKIFTEEELVTPCTSTEEYIDKQLYLRDSYIDNAKSVIKYRILEYLYMDQYYFDPISNVVMGADDKDFILHHIELYIRFKKCQKPSIFLLSRNRIYISTFDYDRDRRFLSYYLFLPFAEDNDWRLSEAKKYIEENAREVAKTFYKKGQTRLPKELVLKDYIKKPTMKKLLEMANEKGDTEFAAILLDKMKESEVSKNRFSL